MKNVFIGSNRLINRIASHNYINNSELKKKISSDLFEFFNSAYQYSGGFKSFDNDSIAYTTDNEQMRKDKNL